MGKRREPLKLDEEGYFCREMYGLGRGCEGTTEGGLQALVSLVLLGGNIFSELPTFCQLELKRHCMAMGVLQVKIYDHSLLFVAEESEKF